MNKEFKVGQMVWIKEHSESGVVTAVEMTTVGGKNVPYYRLDSGFNYLDEQLHQTADDMFEELGFEPTMASNDMVTYECDDGGYIQQIIFFKYPLPQVRFKEYEEYNEDKPQGQFSCYIDLHQAIHQKMIELGWIE